jgi:hypothetical protein
LALSAVASDSTLFDCDTSPLSPLLSTATGLFAFAAPSCSAAESPTASCSFRADWPIAWIAIPAPPDCA